MPVYTITTEDSLSVKVREKIVQSVTHIHCDVTGAPPEFVNIVFMEGYTLKKNYKIAIVGNVRKGGNRNLELTENLRSTIAEGVAAASDTPLNQVTSEQIGFPASWGMEGGEILPEPGAEDVWLNRAQS